MTKPDPTMKETLIATCLTLAAGTQALAAEPERVDILIQGGLVVTMDQERRVIEGGTVAIRDGVIVAVGEARELAEQYTADEVIDATGKVIIPGLINTHTHVPMTLFRGIADDLELHEWLTQYIFPAEARNVTEPFVRAGTRLALAEMIRGGVTTFCDMYYFEEAIAEETAKAGVRGVLGQAIVDFPAPDHKTPAATFTATEQFVRKWKGHPLIVPAFAPHAPYTVSKTNLQRARRLADEYEVPLIIHVSETHDEVDRITKEQGASPIHYLHKIGVLGRRTIAAHAIHVSSSEMDLLAETGTGVSHNPHSNMKLASGVAPVPDMLARGIAVGLGTDGAASNNDLDLWDEMDMAAKLHKVFTRNPQAVPAIEAFAMATINGAKALHLDDITGSLESGKRADVAIVDLNGLHQYPRYNIYSTLVYTTKAADVRTVVINGRVVMKDRQLLTLDEEAIRREATEYRDAIARSLEKEK
jgi:5-methylthioadenosine/S-adenosylhomocysteine deaminase